MVGVEVGGDAMEKLFDLVAFEFSPRRGVMIFLEDRLDRLELGKREGDLPDVSEPTVLSSDTVQGVSAGYYVGQLYIESTDGEQAVMKQTQHEVANEQVYTTGEGVERMDHPLIMGLDDTHFPVFGAEDVPTDTLGLPEAPLTRPG